ncbi:hypothetical protein JZ751_029102 [Albula glossodonta]|uniref:Lysophosphatidic acid phosphatase type 6 n=1 Tax=Albula glossodonta TaxID=121402 RepID=A0A8T2P8B8_9TELE|nr:hypothetical protein JZ751_029102 [Albula glossodonta]
MRSHWIRVGLFGSVGLGSMLWTEKKSTPVQTNPGKFSANHGDQSPYELKLVQVLFRHGARTPLKSIPDVLEAQWVPNLLEAPAHTQVNYVVTDLRGGPRPPAPVEDSYRANTLTGGTYPGQLTTLGMQQLYDLGERLRKRYIEDTQFLMPEFNPAEVYVRSTNIVRTIESASHRWTESAQLPDIAADLTMIKGALGIASHQRVDFILIRDDMVARETHGLPCPPVLNTWRSTVEQRAVDMICHIYEPSKRKLFLYSVHDTTLMPCLMALGIFDMKWPPYAAEITLELHQHRTTKEAFVKVSYIGQDKLIPGCSGVYCPLKEFKEALSAYSLTSDHYRSLCNQTPGD